MLRNRMILAAVIAIAVIQAPYSLGVFTGVLEHRLEAQTTIGPIELVSSAARTATFNGDARQNPLGARGAHLLLNVTAASGTTPTLDVKLQWLDPTTSTWSDITGATFQRITAVGTRTLIIYPGPEGRGVIRSVTGTDPAAGAEISETVPANSRWHVVGAAFSLVTDGTAGNRVVNLTFDDGTTVYSRASSGTVHALSTTAFYGAGIVGTNSSSSALAFVIPLPDLMMTGGHRLRTDTQLRSAGDNYTAPQLLVEEFVGNYAATSLPRTFRAVATIAGTTPSFTFSISGTTLP